MNKSAENTFSDRDVQCCTPVKGKKWCPTYIFASNNPTVALKNWKAFKQLVKGYLDALCGASSAGGATTTTPTPEKPATAPGNGKERRYNRIAEMPSYAQPTIIKMVDGGFIGGTGSGAKDENNRPADLDLSIDMIRVFVTNDRAGLYDKKP